MVSRTGFSLIEVIVALLVLAIGAAGALAAGALAIRTLARAELQEASARLAAEALDSLLQAPAPAPGIMERDGFLVSWSTQEVDGGTRLLQVSVQPPGPTLPVWRLSGVHLHLPALEAGDQ